MDEAALLHLNSWHELSVHSIFILQRQHEDFSRKVISTWDNRTTCIKLCTSHLLVWATDQSTRVCLLNVVMDFCPSM